MFNPKGEIIIANIGTFTADKDGFNGQLRTLSVRDKSVVSDAPPVERADPSEPGHVGAPFDGSVTMRVAKGDRVEAGDTVATIEAMKMEAAITAPVAGTVSRLAVPEATPVQAGDLLLVIA